MSLDQQDGGSGLSFSTTTGAGAIGALLMVIGWLVAQDGFLLSREPGIPLHASMAGLPADMVEARLWQDPFVAVSDHLTKISPVLDSKASSGRKPEEEVLSEWLREPYPGYAATQSLVQEAIENGTGASIWIVPVQGRSGYEEAERRRRKRQALVTALLTEGYRASSGFGPGRLGQAMLCPNEDEQNRFIQALTPSGGRFLRDPENFVHPLHLEFLDQCGDVGLEGGPVAYEVFEQYGASRRPGRVLLLWVGEEAVAELSGSRDPLALYRDMVATLFSDDVDGEKINELTVRVFGPASSDGYFELANRHLGQSDPLVVRQLLERADDYLDEGLDEEHRDNLAEAFREWWGDEGRLAELQAEVERLAQDVEEISEALEVIEVEDIDVTWHQTVVQRHLLAWVRLSERERRSRVRNDFGSWLDVCSNDNSRSLKKSRREGTTCSSVLGNIETVVLPLINSVDSFPLLFDVVDIFESSEIDDSDLQWPVTVVRNWSREQARPLQQTIRRNLSVLSDMATIPTGLSGKVDPRRCLELLGQPPPESLAEAYERLEKRLQDQLSGNRFDRNRFVTRTLSTDERQIARLADELRARQIDLAKPEHGVVLISEWDTFYGRALPRLFEIEARWGSGLQLEEDQEKTDFIEEFCEVMGIEDPTIVVPNFRRIHYLRGLDGVLPRQPDQTLDDQLQAAMEGARESVADSWNPMANRSRRDAPGHASGPAQLDTARRIGEQVVDWDRQLRAAGAGRVRAIGVVGSDFHDKEILLQALRREFSDIVFFTTDLDARYLDPDKVRWNRNLLIASSYGLTPPLPPGPPDPADAVDEAETGVEVADISATVTEPDEEATETTGASSGPPSGSSPSSVDGWSFPPFRASYSVSSFRAGRFALTGAEEFEELEPRVFEVTRTGFYDLDAPRDGSASEFILISLGLAFLGIAFAGVLGVRWRERQDHWRPRRAILGGFLLLVIFLVFLWAMHWVSNQPGEEPLAWFDGISVWPVNLLRLVAIFAAVGLLLLAERRIQTSERRVRRYFERPEQAGDDPRRPATVSAEETADRKDAGEVQRRSSLWRRLGRASADLPSRLSNERLDRWPEPMIPRPDAGGEVDESRERVDATALWERYETLARPSSRWLRVGAMAALALGFVAVLLLLGLLSMPATPVRGEWSRWIDLTLRIGVVAAVSVLTLWLLDATLLCLGFVRTLSSRPTWWPENRSVADEINQRKLKDPGKIRDWLDVEVTAVLTSSLWACLAFPFIPVLLIVVAQSQVFDALPWSAVLVSVVAALLVITILSAVVLWSQVQRSKTQAQHNLNRILSQRLADAKDQDDTTVRQLELLREGIANEKRGALGGWFSNPLVRTAFLLLAGLVILVLDTLYG